MVRAGRPILVAAFTWALCTIPSPCRAEPHQTRAWIQGKVLKVRDASTGGEGDFDNLMTIKVKRDEHAAYISDDYGTAIPGPGCVTVTGEDVSAGRPEDLYFPNWGHYTVKCPFTELKKVDINAGPGDDEVEVILSHVPVKIVGGAGNDDLEYWSCDPPPYFSTSNINGGLGDDYIVGGAGDDVLSGSRGGDYIEGTCGSDRLSGGGGGDSINADDTNWCDNHCPPTTDRITCGTGTYYPPDPSGVDIIAPSCYR
jgi:Ca2+-binding RTX toxin-like protein